MNSYAKILEEVRRYNTSEVIRMLEENIREESAKKNKTQGKLTIIKNMLKNSVAEWSNYNKCHTDNGHYYFLDGHRMFRATDNMGYPEAEEHERLKNLDKFFDSTDYDDRLTFSKQEIQTYIKIDGLKRRNPGKPFFILSDKGFLYGFNPFFLLDYIDYTGQESALVKNPINPMMDTEKTALVLPVNVRNISMDQFYNWRSRVFGEAIPNTAEKITV